MKEETLTETLTTEQPRAGWRFRAGVIIFVVGFLSPLFIPLVAATDLPTKWKAMISGLLAVGIPELFSLVAIAVLGKSGFHYLKGRLFAFFKKYGPAEHVTRARYRIGLVMLGLPLLFGWLAPYASHLIPEYGAHRIVYGIAGDVLLIVSLFVLGGEFWDKVRALFLYSAKAQLHEQEVA